VLLALTLAGWAGCRQPPHAGSRAARDAVVRVEDARSGVPAGPPARAFRIEAPADLLRGPHAAGRIVDVRLDNGRAAFVVQAIGSVFGFARSGGNLIDAAAVPDGRDELSQMFLYLGEDFPRQAVYHELAIGEGAPGEAVVLARGTDSQDRQLEIETVYALSPGSRALRLTTVVRNHGSALVPGFAIGDAIEWGSASPEAAGQPRCPPGSGVLSHVVAVGTYGSYAYLGPAEQGFRCIDDFGWVNSVLGAFDLPPAGAGDAGAPGATVVRWIAVGDRADTASATAAAREARGDVLGRAAVLAVGDGGEPVPEAVVHFSRGREAPAESARTDAAGRGVALLPPGLYHVDADAPGRSPAGVVEVGVPAGEPVELPLSAPGRLELEVLTAATETDAGERAPVRVVVRGRPPTPDPSFGGPYTAGGAGNSFVLAEGRATRPIPPGSYQVLVTRGPEYDLLQQTVDIPPGGTGSVHGTLVRRVETSGWLAADLHVHTTASSDAGTPPRDRVLGCAAEGVELVVSADHNVLTDLAPQVEALGLSAWLGAVPGVEVTTDLSQQPLGHINVFPLAVDPARPDAIDPIPWLDLGLPELIAGARRIPGVLVQIDHPRSPRNGTFALLGVGSDDNVPPASLAFDFDLLEVANGLGFQGRAAATADWARLVRCGRRVTPTGGSDAHALLQGPCGYPRTWIFAGRDRPEGLTPEAFATQLRAGRVVVSTGPFVVLRVDDVPPGETLSPKARGVLVQLRVEAAPWVDVRRVRVLVNGVEALSLAPTARQPETVRLETQAPLALTGDAAIWAEVEGDAPYPFLPADSLIRPWALTGAVWVDTDGDGQVKPAGAACQP